MTPEGRAPSSYELYFERPDDVEVQIQRAHSELRTRHCGPLAKAMSPDHCQSMADAIDLSETRCMAALESAIEEEEARREAFGLAEAERDWDMMNEAEDATLVEVMRYMPADVMEAKEKSAYLKRWLDRSGALGEHHFEALLESIGGNAPPLSFRRGA